MPEWHIYILASKSRVLYTGVSRNLILRLDQHRRGVADGFTSRYRINRLVYVEAAARAMDAFEREKQIKRWRREKKIALIESMNPEWRDLGEDVLGSRIGDRDCTAEIPPLRSG